MSIQYRNRYRTSARDPEPIGACDNCFFLYQLDDLQPEKKMTGDHLTETGRLVCERCLDVPTEQDRTIILKPDPEPVRDPRPEVQDEDA